MGFIDKLHITIFKANARHVEANMPITPDVLQAHGYLHGGATISFLETIASVGAENLCDLTQEVPFGIDVHVRHCKSGTKGSLRGFADLDRIEQNKQFWTVVAYDDSGDVISKGTVVTKIVSYSHLSQRSN